MKTFSHVARVDICSGVTTSIRYNSLKLTKTGYLVASFSPFP